MTTTLNLFQLVSRSPSNPVAASTLGHQWNFLRNPNEEDWSLATRPGMLRLRGNPHSLFEKKSPAWVGRRLDDFRVEATALLDFNPVSNNEEAGITLFMNRKNHHDLVVRGAGKTREIVLGFHLGEIHDVHARQRLGPGPVRLRVSSDLGFYYFSYAEAAGAWHTLGKVEAKYLATDIASGFTGVFVAMFATGNGKSSQSPADFDWFEYKHIPKHDLGPTKN